MTEKEEVFTQELGKIVPEYESRFFMVRKFFWTRLKESIDLAALKNDARILDLGCGIGHLLSEIKKQNATCTGVGVDLNARIMSLHIPGCQFIIADAAKLPFSDGYFDVVFALDILEHIPNIELTVAEIRRVLKPEGLLIVVGPTESVFYKFCRFLIKGTFSMKSGPGGGEHYHSIMFLRQRIRELGFSLEEKITLPKYFPLALDEVLKFKRNK